MSTSTTPVVAFPNFYSTTDQLLKDLLGNAVNEQALPPQYAGHRVNIATLVPAENSAMSLTAVYEALKGKDIKAMGTIPGVKTKFIIEDIACVLFKRATSCVRRLIGVAQTGSVTEINTSRDWDHFAKDLQVLHAVLSSKAAFIPDRILSTYLAGLEGLQAAAGHQPQIEVMCNKLRNILKNCKPRAPKVVAPAPTAETQAEEIKAIIGVTEVVADKVN